MNADRLLALYEQVAEAPDAVARMRGLVLDLAVRGKLVAQDAADEPASELLKRIAAEKARLVKVGEIRKPKPLDPVDAHPFELPSSWKWVRLGQIAELVRGISFPASAKSIVPANGRIPCFRSGNVQSSTIWSDFIYVPEDTLTSPDQLVRSGDILISIANSYALVGKCCIVNDTPYPATFGAFLAAIRLHEIVSEYAKAFLVSDFSATSFRIGSSQTTNIANITFSTIRGHLFPLPPLAEQRRIVAKVDELMGLCDRLEAARSAREGTRDQLAAASLARLNAPDPETFQADARFALGALPALATRPDQIKALRQTILNLAVRGKLVDQDPTDEPISGTLNRAMARRAALVKAKKIRAKKLDGYEDLETDANLPSSWVLERLGNLVDPENTISYGVLVPGEEVPDGIPFVRAQDLALSGHPERPNKTISPEIEKAYARTRLRGGEILVCVVGSIGKLGIVPQSWAGANIARAVARVLPIPEISREYLLVVLRGEPVQACFNEATRTLAQPTLNVGLIEQTPIPLPPLAEQHRIVAKVDELMGLCDRLEASLTASAHTRLTLLDALIAEALDPMTLDEAA
jgi:type I restriction enzyme S subunit